MLFGGLLFVVCTGISAERRQRAPRWHSDLASLLDCFFSSPSPAPAFVANLELLVELSVLQSELQAAMEGTSIEGEDPITVTGVELQVVTGGVAVSIQLAGAPTANVWALGTLVHDGGALRLASLRWSDETSAAIHDPAREATYARSLARSWRL